MKPHNHSREDEFSLVLAGAVGFRIGDRVQRAPWRRPGEAPGTPHAMWNAYNTPARVLEILSPGGWKPTWRSCRPSWRTRMVPTPGSTTSWPQGTASPSRTTGSRSWSRPTASSDPATAAGPQQGRRAVAISSPTPSTTCAGWMPSRVIPSAFGAGREAMSPKCLEPEGSSSGKSQRRPLSCADLAGTDRVRRPCGFQPHALPTELPARGPGLVAPVERSRRGFEPATSALTGRRATGPSCSTGPRMVVFLCPQRSSTASPPGGGSRPLDDVGPAWLRVGRVGLELTTPRLKAGCSTN